MLESNAEADRLTTLASYHIMDSPPEPAFDVIVDEAAFLTNTPISLISLVDAQRQWFKAKLGIDREQDLVEHSICAHAIRGDETFIVSDASVDPRFSEFPTVRGDGGFRFYAGAPLTMRNGAKLGTLCVLDVEPRADLSEIERLALEALARRTVAAFELRRDMLDLAAKGGDGGESAVAAGVWLEQAAVLLSKASAALEHADATGPLAHLEQVITMVDELRAGP